MSRKRIRLITGACIAFCFFASVLIKMHSMYFNFNRRIDTLINEQNPIISASINGQFFEIKLNDPNRVIELQSLTTEFEIPVVFNFNNQYKIYFDGYEMTSGDEYGYKVNSIDENTQIHFQISNTYTGNTMEYTIKTYPDFLPHFTVTGTGSPIAGDYYINSFTPSAILKLNNMGDVLYYKYGNGLALSDFKKVETISGQTRYIYNEQYGTKHTIPNSFYTPVQYVIMDEKYNEIQRISMKKSKAISEDGFPADSHDLFYLDDAHYYAMSYVGKTVTNIPENLWNKEHIYSNVIACVIQEIKDGEVVFEWDSTEHPELYELASFENDFNNTEKEFCDYAHMNSIEVDPNDGNLICSFRNLDAIIKIRKEDGKIQWILGGNGDQFGLTEAQKTSKQHYAQLNANGSLTVFDNGNVNNQSRIVEYWMDEEKKNIDKWGEYKIDGYFSYATGSAERLSVEENIFLIGWGLTENKLQPSATEINFDTGEVYFEIRFFDPVQIYRCTKK